MYGNCSYGCTTYGGIGRVNAGTDYTKTLTDSVVTDSAIIRFSYKVLIDIPILTSVLLKSLRRSISDLYSVTSTLLNKGIKGLIDSFSFTETTLIRSTTKVLTDTPIMLSTLLKSMTRAFADTYLVASTLFNKAIKGLSDTFSLLEVFAIAGQYYRTLTDSIITLSTIIKNVFNVRILNDVLSAIDNGINKLWLKSFSSIIGTIDTIKKYVNGFFVEGWNKIVKIISSFSKESKNDSDWNKTEKFRPSKLKLQDGSYHLLQDNSKINIVIRRGSIFSNITKIVSSWGSNSKNNTTWNK